MTEKPQPTSKQPKRKKPLGEAIQHTDEELDELARVGPEDIEAANALWDGAQKKSKRMKGLLKAKPEEDANTE